MSVADSSMLPSDARRSTPPSTWTVARVETALPTTESA
jgi:hypothetical protein